MHPQRTLPLHRRLKRPRPAASAAMPPRTMSAAVPSSLAPHDSKARLISVTIRRDSWRSHVHRTHTAQRVQFFKRQTRNVGGRGALPSRSLGGSKGDILSRERISPLPGNSAKRCTSPPRSARNPPRFPVQGNKKPPPGSARASCCVVCVFLGGRKSHRGELPFASIKIPVNLG